VIDEHRQAPLDSSTTYFEAKLATERGVGAIDAMPRALQTRRVFHIEGRPISWVSPNPRSDHDLETGLPGAQSQMGDA
jgi:hypothetical protein